MCLPSHIRETNRGKLKAKGKLQDEWKKLCPHTTKKIDKMKKKGVKNLFDFVWKYAKDGEEPSSGIYFVTTLMTIRRECGLSSLFSFSIFFAKLHPLSLSNSLSIFLSCSFCWSKM